MKGAEKAMESMKDMDRVMEREIKKGRTPLKFEQLGFGDYIEGKAFTGAFLSVADWGV